VSDVEPSDAGSQERILAAAKAEFAEHGFAGARVNRIAESARANKQLIYRYFGNKEELYAAVMKSLTSEVIGRFDAAQIDAGFMQAFYASEGPDTRGWARMLAWEGLQGSDPLISRSERQASISRQIEIVRRLQDAGYVARDLDPQFAVAVLLAVTVMPSVMPQMLELSLGKEEASSPTLRNDLVAFLERLFGSKPSRRRR
jgi:AcrR family transcriptional regulator